MFDIWDFASRGEILTKLHRTREETAELSASRGILLSSFLTCAAGFKLDNKEIQRVDKTKFLGIIIDQHLTWKNHIDYITIRR